MSEDSVRRVRLKSEPEILSIHLAQLREEKNIKQSEMQNFTQTAISKIKNSRT